MIVCLHSVVIRGISRAAEAGWEVGEAAKPWLSNVSPSNGMPTTLQRRRRATSPEPRPPLAICRMCSSEFGQGAFCYFGISRCAASCSCSSPSGKHVTRPNWCPLTTHLGASIAVFAKGVIHAMSEHHAAAARERDGNFAPMRREQISEVCSGADQHKSESCCPEHTFPLMSPVSKANCCRSDDGHEDRKQSVSMFFRGNEMERDGRQREDHRSRDAMNKTERRSDRSYSIDMFRP